MRQKYYAFIEHEIVQAIWHGMFRFSSREQASAILKRLATEFFLAPKIRDPDHPEAVFLWVRDLEVTPQQRALGFIGNFARVSLNEAEGKWTMSMTKIDLPLNKHPRRKPLPRAYPNMGHPVLRAASRQKTWPSLQAALEGLAHLHREFPAISTQDVNRLRIRVYGKSEKGVSPIQRVELSVVKRDEGVYAIEIDRLARKIKPEPEPSGIPPTEPQGTHTAKLAKARKKK